MVDGSPFICVWLSMRILSILQYLLHVQMNIQLSDWSLSVNVDRVFSELKSNPFIRIFIISSVFWSVSSGADPWHTRSEIEILQVKTLIYSSSDSTVCCPWRSDHQFCSHSDTHIVDFCPVDLIKVEVVIPLVVALFFLIIWMALLANCSLCSCDCVRNDTDSFE